MSKRTSRNVAAIAGAIANIKNQWDKRKERQRRDALDALNQQLAEGRLRDQQYDEQTRPTIEQKIAQLKRDEESDALNFRGRQADVEAKELNLKQDRTPKRRTFKEIAADAGLGDEEQFAAAEALEGSNDDIDKAIAALSGPGPQGADAGGIDESGVDVRGRGRVLLQRAKREGYGLGGGQGRPGDAQRKTESQVDAVAAKSIMELHPMAMNRNAPYEQQMQAWQGLQKYGIQIPNEAKDWIKYGAKSVDQVEHLQQSPPAQETRVPGQPARPIRMSPTTSGEDRAAQQQRAITRPSQQQAVDYFTRGQRPAPRNGPPNDYPQGHQGPTERRRVVGPPYRQPEMGPPWQGVQPEQSQQMDLDAIQQSMPQMPVDPMQSMFDRIRALREGLESGKRF